MTSTSFYHELVEKTAEVTAETYHKSTAWTNFITEQIIHILRSENVEIETPDTMKKGTIGTSKEYYRVDVTSWVQHKEQISEMCRSVGMEPHLWQLQAAIEHENAGEKWFDEVCKLSFIRCPLRVVIGYGTENAEQKLAILREILRQTNALTDESQEFAVILGCT